MKRATVAVLVVALALWLAGCQGEVESTATRGTVAPDGIGAGPEIPPAASSRIRGAATGTPLDVRLVVRPVDVDAAEDGRGRRAPASRPVALDLIAEGWPGRAADPVLSVGGLHFHEYIHPEPGVLRYVAADRADLPEGAPVVLQYGDDTSTRRVVARSLEVPR